MTMSIEELREIASRLRTEGLNSQQIADELSPVSYTHLTLPTISWV